MNKIIVFSGTTEGKVLSEGFEQAGINHMVCVATKLGEEVMEQGEHTTIRYGRLTQEEMETLFCEEQAERIIDATHPYATEVTKNIKAAAKNCGVSYERVLRGKMSTLVENSNFISCESMEEAVYALSRTKGNILLTTGSKDLSKFGACEELKGRLYARVLPTADSLKLCEDAGIESKHVIAMFGPFTYEMNAAMMKQYDISVVVTKESGAAGGYEEKVQSALDLGCQVISIGRPEEEEGFLVGELLGNLVEQIATPSHLEISLVGIGMGNAQTLTMAAHTAIREANVILGAKRMVSPYKNIGKEVEEIYLSKDIIPYVDDIYQNHQTKKIVVLFSGDSGMYSGAARLYAALNEWAADKAENVKIHIYPGISSISYFASKLAENYSDAAIESWHGKGGDEAYPGHLVEQIKTHEKVFVLLSEAKDVKQLGLLLKAYGLCESQIAVGYQLSYPEENVHYFTVEECISAELPEGLYLARIINPNPEKQLFCAISDDEYTRAKVPMTKQEIRHLSVAALNLTRNAVVYDIGAGTGSVAIEIAKQDASIRVYAIEKKADAVELIRENADKFACGNLEVVEGLAPEALSDLPNPTHAFIGGSSGNLKEIVALLVEMNPKIRIVMNAVTIETVGEISEVLKNYGGADASLVQIQASRNRQAGNYTLMEAMNPVYIASFTAGEA